MRPYILGLTGGCACGKSTLARKLSALGAVHIDADAISHALTAPEGLALPEIRKEFGDGVFFADGTLDRRALAAVVFVDKAQRQALEGIIHPLVQQQMLLQVDKAEEEGKPVCLLDVPLLYETAMDVLCDAVWVVALPPDTQTIRLMNRDGLSREEALARIAAQMSTEEKVARADYVFQTDKPEAETLREVEAKYKELLRMLSRR